MSGRTTRARAKAVAAGGASSSAATTASLEPDAQPPPAKRAKAQKAKKPAAQTTRKKGRLSVLPTLPLDVLFEIFGHLGPADLLHLARTTKSFRNVLLSRQSAFLWKEVYDAVSEVDNFPCPEEISLPKWINMVHGGPFCDEVGCSGRSNKVLWEIRRRLCKSCQDKLLATGYEVWELVGDDVMLLMDGLIDFVPNDFVSRSGRGPHTMYLRADLQNFGEKVRTLAKDFDYTLQTELYPLPKGSPEWEEALAAFKARCKSVRAARHEHAEQCSAKDELRVVLRGDELDGLKEARFEAVKQRLMDMGFEAVDAGAPGIRAHKDVNKAKPLTDRVWQRIGPLLRVQAEVARDHRLAMERHDRMLTRLVCAARSYEQIILGCVAPSTVCFAPERAVAFKLPRVATYLREDADRPDESEHKACARSFAEAHIMEFIEDWITRRQTSLRTELPDVWPRTSSTNEDIATHWPPPTKNPLVDNYTQLADLDLAVYTFKCAAPACKQGNRVFYGLDILAHDCLNRLEKDQFGAIKPGELSQPVDFALHASPLHDYHPAALRIVQLLELDPTKARPVDLDRADKFFTAEPREAPPEGQPFMTWRQAVHAGATWCDLNSIRIVNEREKTYIGKYHDVFDAGGPLHAIDADPDWACTRCDSITNSLGPIGNKASRWCTLAAIRAHLVAVHDIANGQEGQDYLYNRHKDRLTLDGDEDAYTHLPRGVDVDVGIDALDGMGGPFNPFNLFNSMWPGGQGPPPWIAHMMAGLFSDDSDPDSDDSMDF